MKGRAWLILQGDKIKETGGGEKVESQEQKRQRYNEKKKGPFFPQQLLANTTILSKQIFIRADCFLFPPFLQEWEDSELALQKTSQDRFSYSIFLELVPW